MGITDRHKPVDILLVEDNQGDVDLAKEALEESKISNRLMVANDGEVAMEILFKKGKYQNEPSPDLIILDLNLPKMDGREVLARIKTDKELKKIPVVILTTSRAEEDVLRSYNLHANCYISKPIGFEQFLQVVKSIETFWMSMVILPTVQQ